MSDLGTVPFSLTLLGEASLRLDGHSLRLPSQKAYCVLAYLLLQHKNRVLIPDILDLLWPHSAVANARHSLSQLVYAVKQRCGYQELLYRDMEYVGVVSALVTSDIVEFETAARTRKYDRAIRLYGGPFLAGIEVKADERFEHWKDGITARLASTYRHCVGNLVRSAAIEPPQSVEAWTKECLRLDPTAAIVAMLHFRSIAEQGRQADAELGITEYLQQHEQDLSPDDTHALTEARNLFASANSALAVSQVSSKEPAFIGRTAEVVQLRELWSQAVDGHVGAVVLTGDPGIGKTRLLYQLARFAAIRGARVQTGCASPATTRLAYAGIAEVFRGVVETSAREDARLPIMRQISSAGLSPADAEARGSTEQQLYAEVEQFVRTLVNERPLLITIDDLQWIDESSFRLLIYLLYRCRGHPLLVAACTRPEGDHLIDQFQAVVDTVTVPVGPLPTGVADQLLASHCASRGCILSAETRSTLLARAGGNPLFLTALIDDRTRTMQLSGGDNSVDASLPPSISDLVLGRVRRLNDATQHALRTLAVLRSQEPVEVIAKCGQASVMRTARAIDELVRLRLAADGPLGAMPAHDLIAEVVYDAMPASVRRLFHHRASIVLRGRGAAVVAHHAQLAHDSKRACRAALRAATAAGNIRAYSEAEYFFDIARSCASSPLARARVAGKYLQFACSLDRFSASTADVALARQYFTRVGDEAGLVRCDAVDLDAAMSVGTRALSEITDAAGCLVAKAEGMRDTTLAAEMSSVLYRAVELGSVQGPAAQWVNDAVRIAQSAKVDWQVALLGKAAVLSFFTVGSRQAERLAEGLHALAGDDVRLQALAFGYVGVTLMLLGKLSEAEQYYQRALDLAQGPALADAYHKASMNLALLETDMGRFHMAKARLVGSVRGRMPTLVNIANQGFLAIEVDDLEAAEVAAEELRQRSRTLNAAMGWAAAATLTGLAAWARGDYARSANEARVVEGLINTIPFHSDDSYARILMARVRSLVDPEIAIRLLEQPFRRAAVPQLRVDLERGVLLLRHGSDAGSAALKGVADRAEAIGAVPIAVRAASALGD